VQIHLFLTSALDGGEWSASCPSRFSPREKGPGIQWTEGWVVPRAGLDAVVWKKNPQPLSGLEPPIIQRYNTELSWLLLSWKQKIYHRVHKKPPMWDSATCCLFTMRNCHPPTNLQTGRPPLVGCLQLVIQYIRSWPFISGRRLHPRPEYIAQGLIKYTNSKALV
jgi:hypothetical protein